MISGLLKMTVAMKLDRIAKIIVSKIPMVASKRMPALINSPAFSCLFWALRLAVYFIMAELTPKSLKRIIIEEGIRATVYNPYSSDVNSLASTIVPIAIIKVEITAPMNSLKLPDTDVLPISTALSMIFSFLH